MPDREPYGLLHNLLRISRISSLLTIPDSRSETLRWLVAIRGNVALALLCVALTTLLVPGDTSGNIVYIIAICCSFVITSIFYSLVLNAARSERVVTLLREAILPLDVVLITLCIYVSSGALSPMIILYSVGVVLSIILLDPIGVFRIAAISISLYSCLAFGEAYRLIPYAQDYWGGVDVHHGATPITYALYLIVVGSMLMAEAYIGNRIAHIINQRNSRIDSQMRDLDTMYRITGGLGSLTNEGEIADYLVSALKSLQGTSICVISLVKKDRDESSGKPEIVASTGLTLAELASLRKATFPMPGVRSLFEKGEPIMLEDLRQHPDYGTFLPTHKSKSVYIYPIVAEHQVLGAMSLSFDKPKSLSKEYRALLATISSQAGMAVQRARLFSDTHRLAREMSLLYDIGLYTGSTLSPGEVIKRTADNIEKLMNPDMFYIALYDADSKTITVELCKENGRIMPKMKMGLDRGGLTGKIVASKEPLLVHDWLSDGQQYNNVAKRVGGDMLSFLGVPMMFDGRVTGVLSVQCTRPHAFNRNDQGLLQAMAAQTAMALENARLHQLAQTRAITDSLTQVYNHGHFVGLVHEAVAASDGNDSQISLIMLDIDHFKLYNDKYGHVAGDKMLTMVADALKQSVREGDAVGRWGGEEFGVLLLGVGLQDAKKIARTIRRKVAEIAAVDGRGKAVAGPTVSQGISSYPFPSLDATHLIEEADAALYHAKEQGRNQLVVSEAATSADGNTNTVPRLPARVLKNATVTTGHLMD